MIEACRACLKMSSIENLVSLFQPQNGRNSLSDAMMRFASVTVMQDDELPSSICRPCADRLNDSYAFRLLCETSDRTLRNNLIKIKSENAVREYSSTGRQNVPKIETDSPTVKVDHSENSDFDREDDRLSFDGKTEFESSEDEKLQIECDNTVQSPTKIRDRRARKRESYADKSADESGGPDKKPGRSRKEQCSTCGKVMSSRFRLKMHLRIHTGEKPFACNYCHKKFALSQNLKVHQRVHTGEKPLLCGDCGKAFAQSAGLVAHMRLHTGETPYKCSLCPVSFRTPGHLQYHMRQHTGEKKFECGICHKAFIMRSDLTQHAKTHTGERRYICTICGLRLTRSSHLTRHMMVHTGEKPHKCNACGSSYAQKADLSRHAKRYPKGICKEQTVDVKIKLSYNDNITAQTE